MHLTRMRAPPSPPPPQWQCCIEQKATAPTLRRLRAHECSRPTARPLTPSSRVYEKAARNEALGVNMSIVIGVASVLAVALSGVRADGNGTYTNPTIHYNTPDPGALWDPETGLYWVRGAAK